MPDFANRVPRAGLSLRADGVHADVDAEVPGALRAEPRLESRMSDQRQWPNTLGGAAGVVRLEQDRNPIVRLEGRSKESKGCLSIDCHERASVLGQDNSADERRLLAVRS